MLSAGRHFCHSQSSATKSVDEGLVLSSIQTNQSPQTTLPLRAYLERQNHPADDGLEKTLLVRKTVIEERISQVSSGSQISASDLDQIKTDAAQTLSMARAGFLQGRVATALLKSVPDSAVKRRIMKSRQMPNVLKAAYLKLYEQSAHEIDEIQAFDKSQRRTLKILRFEQARLQTQLSISDISKPLAAELTSDQVAELMAVKATKTQTPFSTDDLLNGYRGYLRDMTLVGAGFRDCGLTIAEQAAIEMYSEGAYMDINGYLWSKSPSEKDKMRLQPIIDAMVSGMNKLNPYQGIVYRDVVVRDSSGFLKEHTPGLTVVYRGFTSTSIRGGYSTSRKIHLTIHSKTGRYISPLAQLWTESEVLFMPNSRFKVISRQDLTDGSSQIELDEI